MTVGRFRAPFAASLSLGALAVVALGACGSRGSLDYDIVQVVAAGDDASTETPDADVPDTNATIDVNVPDTNVPVDTGVDAPVEASVINCGLCVATSCGSDIVACLTDTTCQQTLTCAVQTCLTGGIDLQCFLGCANGNSASLAQLITMFQCITQTCGPQCTSVLGGLGGSGGLIGGGSGGGSGGLIGGLIGGGNGGGTSGATGGGAGANGSEVPNASRSESSRARARVLFSEYPQISSSVR
jgi:hypothetical protein